FVCVRNVRFTDRCRRSADVRTPKRPLHWIIAATRRGGWRNRPERVLADGRENAPLAFGMRRRLSRVLWRRPRLASNAKTEQVWSKPAAIWRISGESVTQSFAPA